MSVGWDQFRVDGESEAHLLREIAQEGSISKLGRPAKYELGISYVGGWETMHDGVATAVRRHACALRSTGIPVFLQSESYTHANMGVTTTVEYHSLPQAVLKEVDHITRLDHRMTTVVVRHTVPTQTNIEALVYPKGARFMTENALEMHRRRTVLYAAFEEDVIPKYRVRILNLLGQIWTPSQAAKEWLERSGVSIPIKVIPHPFSEDDPMASVGDRKNDGAFRFLNISKWEPRKGQHDLIGGFLLAFSPEDSVELALKCNPFCKCDNYPADWRDSIQNWLQEDQVKQNGWCDANVLLKIRPIWNKRLSREQIAQMYEQSDCYVSTGRTEGFDLPAFDAKLARRRLVHADNGACWDYRTTTDVVIPHPARVAFHPWYKFKDATWPDFDATDVAKALKRAYLTRDRLQLDMDRSKFSMSHVGKAMRCAIEELAPEMKDVNE